MHCDTLTVCCDRGLSLYDCALQNNLIELEKSGCAVQCFAVFTQGGCADVAFYNYLDFYLKSIKEHNVKSVLCHDDFVQCINGESVGALLTIENLGFLHSLEELYRLHDSGVRMASLVWNYKNKFAYPNLIFEGGVPLFEERESRSLTPSGRQAVELLDELKIIVDVSHLSDGGVEGILRGRKIPVVASHSNALEICGVSRNLKDGQIKGIADCGGVVGVNFCKDFLGEGDTFELVLKHIKHLIKVGGEEVVAFGSDFDGIPAPPGLEDCSKMPALIDFLSANGVGLSVLEKICYKNFARVFKEVCG